MGSMFPVPTRVLVNFAQSGILSNPVSEPITVTLPNRR